MNGASAIIPIGTVVLFVFVSLVLGILFHIRLENRYPGMPRKNVVINRWRNTWTEFNRLLAEEDPYKSIVAMLKKILGAGFELAKWLLTLVAIQGIAQASNSPIMYGFSYILLSLISIYFSAIANQWFNYLLHAELPSKLERIILFCIAFATSLLIASYIYSVTKTVAESVFPQERIEASSPPTKKWGKRWNEV